MSNTGWVCPRCSKVHAPFVQSCNCSPGLGSPLPNGLPGYGPATSGVAIIPQSLPMPKYEYQKDHPGAFVVTCK